MAVVFRLPFISSVLKNTATEKKRGGEGIGNTLTNYPLYIAVEVTPAVSNVISLCNECDDWFVRAAFSSRAEYSNPLRYCSLQ